MDTSVPTWVLRTVLVCLTACGGVTSAELDDGLGAGAGVELPASTLGAALRGEDGAWSYTELSNTHCRDGSPSGLAVNLHRPSKRVLIYLEGGSWCTDELSCSVNSTSARDYAGLLGWIVGVGGIFDRADPENPLRDWNYVFVPYCSGDLHSGANPDAYVPGVGPQQFVGYLNTQKFLERIVATFPDAEDVLLVGGSAGGIGAIRVSLLVQRAFPYARFKLLTDSGPPVSKDVYAPCLQRRERELFRLDRTILAECGTDCPDPDDAWLDYSLFVAKTLNGAPFGIVEAIEDGGVRGFLGEGSRDCTELRLDRTVDAAAFRADLTVTAHSAASNAPSLAS